MKVIAKHIITYLTIFSLFFSSLGVTFYYHHCNKEQITLKSLTGKIDCKHQKKDIIPEQNINSCCHNFESEHDSCHQQDKNNTTNSLRINEVSCCVDSQVTNQLNTEFLNYSKQKIEVKPLVDNNKEEKHEYKSDLITKTKDYLDKKVIQPVKKFISLLRQICQFASNSDYEDHSI